MAVERTVSVVVFSLFGTREHFVGLLYLSELHVSAGVTVGVQLLYLLKV